MLGKGVPSVNGMSDWPRAIFFDVGDTLVRARRPYDETIAAISQDIGLKLPVAAIDNLAAHLDACVMTRTEQLRPFTFPAPESQQFWLETYHSFFARFLSDVEALQLAHAVRALLSSPAGYALFDDTVPTLERLRAHGYRLGIISNWEAWLPELLEATHINTYFDHVIISGVCGVEKPDPRIFTLAVQESGYGTDEVVYIGDRPAHDVEPALAVGITPILLDQTGRYPDSQTPIRITSLSELPTVLQQLQSHVPLPRG